MWFRNRVGGKHLFFAADDIGGSLFAGGHSRRLREHPNGLLEGDALELRGHFRGDAEHGDTAARVFRERSEERGEVGLIGVHIEQTVAHAERGFEFFGRFGDDFQA